MKTDPIWAEARATSVLIVDDDPDCLSTMAELLTMYGYEVRTASHGSAAIQSVQIFRPDVVLLDLAMPGLDGYSVAAAIRADKNNDRIFVAAVTGCSMPSDRLRSAAVGIDVHLIKPVAIINVLEVLRARTASYRE